MTETIEVVAAVVRRRGRVLLGRRPPGKRHAGQWEFPGGKIRAGESVREAVSRELTEELGLLVEAVGGVLFRAEDPGSPFVVSFFPVRAEGQPRPLVHSHLGWFTNDELMGLPLAPADYRFVQSLPRTGAALDAPKAPH